MFIPSIMCVHGEYLFPLCRARFGGGFTSWGQPFRLRHIVTGKFLGVKVVGGCTEGATEGKEKYSVALLDPSEASKEASAFCFTNFTIKVRA